MTRPTTAETGTVLPAGLIAAGLTAALLAALMVNNSIGDQGRVVLVAIHLIVVAAAAALRATAERAGRRSLAFWGLAGWAILSLVWTAATKPSELTYSELYHTPMYVFWLVAGVFYLAGVIGRPVRESALDLLVVLQTAFLGVFVIVLSDDEIVFADRYGYAALAVGLIWLADGIVRLRRRP